eukprot:403340610
MVDSTQITLNTSLAQQSPSPHAGSFSKFANQNQMFFSGSVASPSSFSKFQPNQLPQIKNAYKPQNFLAMSPKQGMSRQSPDTSQANITNMNSMGAKSLSQAQLQRMNYQTLDANQKRSMINTRNMSTQNLYNSQISLQNLSETLDKSLIQAKQEQFKSTKQVYAMEYKVQKLISKDQQMQKRLENEKKRADELMQVRQSYDDKVMQLKKSQLEREQKMNEYAEKNSQNKSLSIKQKVEKQNEIFMMRKEMVDEVKNQRQFIEQEKERQRQELLDQKYYSAQMIKQQQYEAKQKMNMYKQYKDTQRKISYIERVNLEKNKKDRNDQRAQELQSIEEELVDKLKKSQDLLKSGVVMRRNGMGQTLYGSTIQSMNGSMTADYPNQLAL